MRSLQGRVVAMSAALLLPQSVTAQQSSAGLVIRMGETWIFRIENGQPVSARPAASGDTPQKGELMVSLQPRQGMIMAILNNTDNWYNYHAFLAAGQDPGGTATSVCTLMAGGKMSVENWPNALPAIRILDFELTQPGKMVCR